MSVQVLYRLRHWDTKIFHLAFASVEEVQRFASEWTVADKKSVDTEKLDAIKMDLREQTCTVEIPKEQIGHLFRVLSGYRLVKLREEHLTLEQYFKRVYEEGDR